MNTAKLEETEIQALLPTVPDWSLRSGSLHRQFRFADFVSAFGFMTRVALLAERANHHPEWSNTYRKVDIHLCTHEVGGISQRDFSLAAEIDAALVQQLTTEG